MSRINLNIVATGDFSSVNRQLDQLRATVAQINAKGVGAGISARDLESVNRAVSSYDSLLHSTGAFGRQMVNVQDQTAKFGRELESGKLKLGQYFGIMTKSSGQAMGNLRELARQQVALENSVVRTDTTKLGKAYVDTPRLMQQAGRNTAIARKEQQLYNLALSRGGDAMINWGKNTQWAGRQLMVGLTVPMVMFGQKAAQAFKEFDQQMTRMIKVYGDGINTATNEQLDAIRGQVTSLAQDLAGRWGVAMKDTAAMASDLAATGLTGIKLLKATEEATRLATLGELNRQDAMKATIALQSTFGLSGKELAKSVDFLNATENATSTSLQDLVDAIPRAGTVVKQLGGDYKELTAMMVAMREAGVASGEAANAIKSTLGGLINPTSKVRDEFQKFGIDLRSLRNTAGGDPVKMFQALGVELNKLDSISKARLIETLFGKYQFARVSSLIDNIGKKGSQTQKVFEMMNVSAAQMAINSQKELDRIANSSSGRFARAQEAFQARMLPIGEKVLNIATTIMEAFGKVFKFLDDHPALQNFISNIAGLVALVGPVIMLAGVFGNFVGYVIKGFANIKNFKNGFKGFGELVTAESVAAAKAGDLFQASLVNQSEAATILTEALARLNAELGTYRGQAGGAAGGPGPIPPVPPSGGGGRPPRRPSGGPVILGPDGRPVAPAPAPRLIFDQVVPPAMTPSGELVFPGQQPVSAPPRIITTTPRVTSQMPSGGPVRTTMTDAELAAWSPRAETKGGRKGTEILHSTSRAELTSDVQEQILRGSTFGMKLDMADRGEGSLAAAYAEKQKKARDKRVKDFGGSTLISPEDSAVARKNMIDELITRGAWSAKGLPRGGAGSEIQQGLQTVRQNFSLPSQAQAAAMGINMTPEMQQRIMMSQLSNWSEQGGRPQRVEKILAGQGEVSLSGPEMQAWLGSQSRVAQAGRAFVDSTMAESERLLTTHRGQIDENLTKLYNEATVAAGSGDWESTKTATTALHEHLQRNYQFMGENFDQRLATIERQYDSAFKQAFNHPDNAGLEMEERIRRSAVSAQTKVDEILDQEGLHTAEKFASHERDLERVKRQLGISTRYSRQGMGEVVTAAASKSVALAEQVVAAERNVGNAVTESVNESNVAMERAASAENAAARVVQSASIPLPPELVLPGMVKPGAAPAKIIVPGKGVRRAMGGPAYYGPGGGVSGPGGPKDDLIPAYLSNGEFVVRADSVDKVGVNNLRHINETGTLPGYAKGGIIGYDQGDIVKEPSYYTNYNHPNAREMYPAGAAPNDHLWKLLQESPAREKNLPPMEVEDKLAVHEHIKKIMGEEAYIANEAKISEYVNGLTRGQLRDNFGLERHHIVGGEGKAETALGSRLGLSAENQLMRIMGNKTLRGLKKLKTDKTLLGNFENLSSVEIDKAEKSSLEKVFKRGGSPLTWEEKQAASSMVDRLIQAHNDPNHPFKVTSTRTLISLHQTKGLYDSLDNENSWKRYVERGVTSSLRTSGGVSAERLRQMQAYKNWQSIFTNPKSVIWKRGFKKFGPGFADGGPINGPGGPTSDQIPAMLSNGEYVVSAKGHQAAGTHFLDAINNGQFNMGGYAYADGGPVQKFAFGDRVKSAASSVKSRVAPMIESRVERVYDSAVAKVSQALYGEADMILTYDEERRVAQGQQIDAIHESTETTKKSTASSKQAIAAQIQQAKIDLESHKTKLAVIDADRRNAVAGSDAALKLDEQAKIVQQDIVATRQHIAGLEADAAELNGNGGKGGKGGKGRGMMGAGGMGTMMAGMGLGMVGGMLSSSENPNAQKAGTVATFAGMGAMLGPYGMAAGALIGASKAWFDTYQESLDAMRRTVDGYAQNFKNFSVQEQAFFGVQLQSVSDIQINEINKKTDEANVALQQFTDAVKNAAEGTTEYATKQLFINAKSAEDLFNNPAFQAKIQEARVNAQVAGGDKKKQDDAVKTFVEGYARGSGRSDIALQLLSMVQDSLGKEGNKTVAEGAVNTFKEGFKTQQSFLSENGIQNAETQSQFVNKTLPALKDAEQAFSEVVGEKNLQFAGTKIGSNAGMMVDPSALNSLLQTATNSRGFNPINNVVGTLDGKDITETEAKKLITPYLDMIGISMEQVTQLLNDEVKTITTNTGQTFNKGNLTGGEILRSATPSWLDKFANVNSGDGGALDTILSQYGIDLNDPKNAEKINKLTGITGLENKLPDYIDKTFSNIDPQQFVQSMTEMQNAINPTGKSLEELTKSTDSADRAAVDAAIGGFEDLRKKFDSNTQEGKAMADSYDQVVAALTQPVSGNQLQPAKAGLDTLALAAEAAQLRLTELGYTLTSMNGRQIKILIDRVIRTRELQAAQASRIQPLRQSLQDAVRTARETQSATPQDTGGGSSGGGSGGGGGGGFDSKPYDDAIKGQQAIIEGINKEREARQKLADTQKQNDDFLKNEWAIRKKIAEAQGTGDFLAADLAQRELNQLQDQKARDDAEKAKRDAEDKRITAAEAEIKRLQEALDAAQKANQGGGGSSGGGGGGGGAPTTPNLPTGVTAESIEGISRGVIAQGVMKGVMTLPELLKDSRLKQQFAYATQLLGKDAATELFGTFLADSKENIANLVPEIGAAMDSFNTSLMNDSVFKGLPEELRGTFSQKILDIIGDPTTSVKEKNAALQAALKDMGLNADTIDSITKSWGSLGPIIQNTLTTMDLNGASQTFYSRLSSLIPNGEGLLEKMTPEQQAAFNSVVTQMVANGQVGDKEIRDLANRMIPYNSNGSDQGQSFYDYGKGRTNNEAQDNFTKVVTGMIGPASQAAAKESNDKPILMTATASTLLVPKGVVTFTNGVPSFTAQGDPINVIPQQKAEGGYISGPGGPKDDLIPALLSNGEYVVRADAVNHYGSGFLDAVNTKKFADGGKVKEKSKVKRAMEIAKERMFGVPGFMERDTTLKFADGGPVRGSAQTIPNQDFINKVEPLAEQYQHTPYSSKVPGDPSGWGCATSVYWLYTNGMGSSFGLDPSMSDGNLHSSVKDGPINGPYAPGDVVLMYNSKGVNRWADANHTEMVLSGGRVWNGGVGIRGGLSFNYPIKGVKRPIESGYRFSEVDTNSTYPLNDKSKFTIGTFHNGGPIQYSKGSEVMAMVQGGEVVVPTHTVDKVNPLLDALTSGKLGLGDISNHITINGSNHSPKVIAEMVVGEIEKSLKRTTSVSRII